MPPKPPEIRRGQMYWVDWNPARGSEQAGRRPALIVQNDPFNLNERYPNAVVVTISTSGRAIPTHIMVEPDTANGLGAISYIKCEQVITISKDRLEDYIGDVSSVAMKQVDGALKRVLALP
ncbi:MAG: type II toxin-antitoxin system PemK/MazF family toxin [Armatimonadetes bacterium]|nr:type II toxin-antitoxin system PemK/MazF family toxin [Armatimonadota bacterium]